MRKRSTPKSPLLSKEYMINSESQAERDFENRIIDKLYRKAGFSGKQLNAIQSMASEGPNVAKAFTTSWFNFASGFPYYTMFKATRNNKCTALTEVKKLLNPSQFSKSELIRGIDNMRESFPDGPIAFITRLISWDSDLVFYSISALEELEGSAVIVRYEGCTYALLPFNTWIESSCVKRWSPLDYLNL